MRAPLRTVESLQASLLMKNSPDYNTRGLHNMGQASVNLSHNLTWFHRKAIQEFQCSSRARRRAPC